MFLFYPKKDMDTVTGCPVCGHGVRVHHGVVTSHSNPELLTTRICPGSGRKL